MKPSTTLSIILVLSFVGFILAGGIYDILERPISLIPTSTGYSVLVKGTLGQQTLNESLIGIPLHVRIGRTVYVITKHQIRL